MPGQRVVAGRILTGDQFVSDPDGALRRRLQALDGSVVEMEGAAIALVAMVNRVPLVIIRSRLRSRGGVLIRRTLKLEPQTERMM